MRFHILATTDTHGWIHSYDYVEDREVPRGLLGLKDYIEEVRSSGEPVILVDAGDTFQGNPLSHFYAKYYHPLAHPMLKVMSQLGYDMLVVGNHDFNYGQDFIRRIALASPVPYVAANVLQGAKSLFIPFVPVNIGDVKIAMLGITTPAIPWFEHPDFIRGLTFEDAVESVGKWLNILKKDYNHIILVAHMGFERDPLTGEPTRHLPFENALYEILNRFGSEIPLIIYGHTHLRGEPKVINGVGLVQPPPYAEGLIHVIIEADKNTFSIIDMKTIDTLPSQPPRWLEDTHKFLISEMNRVLTTTRTPMEFTAARDCSGIEMLLQFMEISSNAQISVQSIMTPSPLTIPPGEVRVKDIYRIYPFENFLFTIEMTGIEILQMLEKTAEYFTGYELNPDGSVHLIRNPMVAFYNFDIYRGFEYTIDLDKPFGERVKASIDPQATYTVAVNSYRSGGAGGYTAFRKARERGLLWSSNKTIRDMLISWLGRQKYIEPREDNNWRFIPHPAPGEPAYYDPI